MVLAFGAQNLGAIFQVTMTAVGATSGPLGGIFLCGLFIPFMNKFVNLPVLILPQYKQIRGFMPI